MVDGIVRQLGSGIVVECSAVCECMRKNPEIAKAYGEGDWSNPCLIYIGGCRKKACQLSIPDHGDRCLAWPNDTSTWLIDKDTSKIKQIL